MKNNLEEIDQLIKETLSEEESKFYDSLEEQNIFQMIFMLFSGKNGWLMVVMTIVQVLFFGAFVYCIVQFLGTDKTKELITWGFAGVVSLIASSMLKIYGWIRIEHKSTAREIKRIELLLSSLSGKSQD
jgi:hypothetical protein